MVLEQAAQPRAIYDANLGVIEEVVRKVARRNHLSPDESEQLRSDVHFKLLSDGCACLAKLRDIGSLEVFLSVLATNALRDARIKKWGRWRLPAAVKHMGPVAELLYRLVDRDSLSTQEAIDFVLARDGVEMTREEVSALAARLPGTRPRRFLSACEPERLPAPSSVDSVESYAVSRELVPLAEKAKAVLSKALSQFETEERVILKLFYLKGLRWSEIGRARGFDKKRIFRAKDAMHTRLQKAFAEEGLHWDQLQLMLKHGLLDIVLDEELAPHSEMREPDRPIG